MTKSEAKILEKDVVIFPMKYGQTAQETISAENTENNLVNEKKPTVIADDSRFTRLKKSLRKKSASIL